MSFEVVLEVKALDDIQTAIDYYNVQKPGLGNEFEGQLHHHFKILTKNPFFQNKYDEVRCLPMRRFPYMIHFEINETFEEVVIRAVLNTHLNPDRWKE